LKSSNLSTSFVTFLFGLLLGSFGTAFVIREVFPLREHYLAILIALVAGGPILLILFLWYLSIIRYAQRVFGQRGGEVIGRLLTFIIVSISVFFILVMGIFYAAVL